MNVNIKKKTGFTLLEVLMVISMLAIVGGAIITNYGGLEDKTATGTSAHTMSAIENAFTVYQTTEGALPNNLETLIAATPDTPTFVTLETDNAAADATGGVLAGHLSHGLEGKLTVTELDPEPLLDAGITRIRYMDLAGNAMTDDDHDLAIKGADGNPTAVENLAEIDIPGHAFEVPLSGDGNRGRGYYVNLVAGTNVPLAVWNAGADGYNNVLVGADAGATLIALGLGDSSSLIGDGTFTNLNSTPYHGGMGRAEYNHFVALIDISVEPAKLVSIVCPTGHCNVEEYSEFRGQAAGHGHDH